jgi:hypothetical protein
MVTDIEVRHRIAQGAGGIHAVYTRPVIFSSNRDAFGSTCELGAKFLGSNGVNDVYCYIALS